MKRGIRSATLISAVMLTVAAVTGIHASESDALKLNDNTSRISYSLGYQIGGDFRQQGVAMDAQAVVKGIEDAMSGSEPMIPPKAMSSILAELKRKVVDDERKKLHKDQHEAELEYIAEGRKFLKENAKKPGIVKTASGLQYKILKPGTGKIPGPKERVTVNYRGTLVNGHEFDSSYTSGKPATFELSNVIKGWTEGLQLIREGGRIQLFVPYVLAYRDRGPLAHRTLIFDVELISVGDGKQATSSKGVKDSK